MKRGLPFRDAHEAVAHAVKICDDRGTDLTLDEMKQELPNVAHLIGEDVFGYLTLEAGREPQPPAAPRPTRCVRRSGSARRARPVSLLFGRTPSASVFHRAAVAPPIAFPASRMPPMTFSAALFDMDGLLVDSERTIMNTWIDVSNAHGVTLTTTDYLQIVGRSFAEGSSWHG